MFDEFYKKKVIRDFLSLFSESKWKELIILSLEYGIIMLKKNHNVASLSVDDFSNIVDELKEEESKRIKKEMKKFESKSISRERSVSNSKPSSDWRKGDYTVYTNKNEKIPQISEILAKKEKKEINKTFQNYNEKQIYPEWWSDP